MKISVQIFTGFRIRKIITIVLEIKIYWNWHCLYYFLILFIRRYWFESIEFKFKINSKHFFKISQYFYLLTKVLMFPIVCGWTPKSRMEHLLSSLPCIYRETGVAYVSAIGHFRSFAFSQDDQIFCTRFVLSYILVHSKLQWNNCSNQLFLKN